MIVPQTVEILAPIGALMAKQTPAPRNGRFPITILATKQWRKQLIGRVLVALAYSNFDRVVKGEISDIALDPSNPNSVIVTIAWSRKQKLNRNGKLVVGDKRWGKLKDKPREFVIQGSTDTSLSGLVANFNQATGTILVRGADGSLFRIPRRRSKK